MIKDKCCAIWLLNAKNYDFYDDSFNNLSLCMQIPITKIMENYSIEDQTILEGNVTFYLFEKIKSQNSTLKCQLKTISIKSSSSGNNKNESNDKFQIDGKLVETIDFIKQGKVLKGLHHYNASNIDEKKLYLRSIKKFDNWWFLILCSIVFIILSLVSLSYKKDVDHYYFSNRIKDANFYDYDPARKQTFQDFITEFIGFANNSYILNKVRGKPYTYVGESYLRIMMVKSVDCMDYEKSSVNNTQFKLFYNIPNHICLVKDYIGNNIDSDGIYTYRHRKANETYIERNIKTQQGKYDTSGILFKFNLTDAEDTNRKLNDLLELTRPNYKFPPNVKAIEYSSTIYSSSFDLFQTVLVFAEKNSLGFPIKIIDKTINFNLNFYEGSNGILLKLLDTIRIILLGSITIIIYFGYVIQKYLKLKSKGMKFEKLYLIKVLFTLKFVILISSFACYLYSYLTYLLKSRNSKNILLNDGYTDLYIDGKRLENAYEIELISLFIFCLYFIKYFQLFNQIQMIFVAFKMAIKDLLVLSIIIFTLIIIISIILFINYGNTFYEIRTFGRAFIFAINIFLFNEKTILVTRMLNENREFTIVFVIFFIFIVKIILLKLFYPIFIERYRINTDKLEMKFYNTEEKTKLTLKQSNFFIKNSLLFFYRSIVK